MALFCAPKTLTATIQDLIDAKEAEIAGAFAGTGIPIFDSILKELSEALANLAGAATASLAAQAQNSLVDYLEKRIDNEMIAGALANMVSLLNMGAELQNAVRAMMVHNLQRQVSLRLIYLQELQYHAKGILSILGYLNQAYNKDGDPRLKQAYPFILRALNNLKKLQAMADGPKPRFNIGLYRTILADVDNAINILTGSKKSKAAEKFVQSVNRKTNLKKLALAFSDYLWEEILAEQVIRAETYTWHLANFLSVITGGQGIGKVSLIKSPASGDGSIPGLDPNRDNLLKQRTRELRAKRDAWRKFPPTAAEPFKTMEWIDTNKGLLITHDFAMRGAETIVDFKVQWNTLSYASKMLWVMMSPALSVLELTEEEVRNVLKQGNGPDANGGSASQYTTPIIFIPYIASQLTVAKQLIKGFGKSGEDFEAVASDEEAWDNIVKYLTSTDYDKATTSITQVLKLVPQATWLAVSGPFQRPQLRKALIIFSETDKLLNKAIAADQHLLQLLSQFNIMDNPGVKAAMSSLTAAAGQSPVAAAMMSALASGQVGSLASMLSGISAVGVQIKELIKGCPTVKGKTSVTNLEASNNGKVLGDNSKIIVARQKELEDKKAAPIAGPPEDWNVG